MTEICGETFLDKNNKILKTCRICLQEDSTEEENVNLFSETKLSKEVLGKIFMCTNVLISDKECLPKNICKLCMAELEFANSFRLKCLVSESTLTKYCTFIENTSAENSDKNNTVIRASTPNTNDCFFESSPVSHSKVKLITDEVIADALETNLQKTKREHKCNICEKILKTRSSLNSHKISMHKNKKHSGKVTGHGATRLYQCLKCSYSTRRGQSLTYHMRTHTGEKPYECHCGKRFTQPASLTTHQKTHSVEACYTCPKCGKQFKYKQSFKNHQRVHEDGTYICDICKKVVKSNNTLKSHMKRHYNIRNYNCDECGSTFVTCAELINHKKIHEKILSFQCNWCDFKTYMKKVLIIHIKRHSGERLFQCNTCEFTFFTSGDLNRHIRKHTRENPYPCPVCEQKFRHSSSVNKHVRNVHRSQYIWNDVVDRTTVKTVVQVSK